MLDYYCIDENEYEEDENFNLDDYTLEEIMEEFDVVGLYNINPQMKSEILGVVVEVNTYSGEGMFKCFYRYDKGELTFEDEIFDWDENEEEYVEELIWDKDCYESFEEFLEDYDLLDSGLTEDDFEHLEDNTYIRPSKEVGSSDFFTF